MGRTLKIGLIGCPETSVRNYHYSLLNNSEERSFHLLHGGSLKSRESRKVIRYGVWHIWGRREVHTGSWWGNQREREDLEDRGVDGRIILKCTFRK